MLVFSVVALAQAVSALGSDMSCATPADSRISFLSAKSADLHAVSQRRTSAISLLDYFASTTPSGSEMGTNGTWGDSIQSVPGDLHRIYFQNLDGLRNDADETAMYVASMAQLNVGTFCWADPSLNFSIPTVRQRLQTTILNNFGSARSAYSSSTLPETSLTGPAGVYQPGGTFTATTGKWSTRSTGKPLVDPSGMGRWSGLCFLGKRNKRLAVITAYRSPRQSPKGGFGFYEQQYSIMLATGIAKPNVRKQFITDISTFINDLQTNGFEVILSLDANETMGEDKDNGLAQLLKVCNLGDLHLLGPDEPPETYKYGANRRIDFMLGSPAVAAAVNRAGYNSYDNGVFSKHRGLFIDLDFTTLMAPLT